MLQSFVSAGCPKVPTSAFTVLDFSVFARHSSGIGDALVSLPGGIILAVPKSFKVSGDGDWRRERHSRWRDNLALILIACLFVGLFLWLAIQKFSL